MINSIILGDCLEKLKELPENSVDSIVTDPPYHLVSIVKRFGGENARNTPSMNTKEGGVFARKAKGFMGKEWDGVDENGMGIAMNVDMWAECLRVLKPGGHLLAFSGTRTYHRMACAIEDAGFEVRDMIEWIYSTGFPKSLNIGKAVNSLETNEWSKIGKALDNIDQKSIMEIWKRDALFATIKLSKSIIEVGINTPKSFFVPDIAVLYHNPLNEQLSAIFAELKLSVLNHISEENEIIVQKNVGQITIPSLNLARYAVKLSQSLGVLSWSIFTAECDVKEWLNENTEVNHKVDEALKTLRGNKKYSNEEIISVLCVALTDILRLTILNQSKTFQNLDTNQKMECVSAISVIITEYTAENLISNTVAILKSKAVDKLQGNEREVVGKTQSVQFQEKGYEYKGDKKGSGFNNEKYWGFGNDVTKGTSEWEGWGTALKPAHEPICMARKPLGQQELDIAKNICYNITEKGLITNSKIIWRIKNVKSVVKQKTSNYSTQTQQQKMVEVSAEFVETKENDCVGKKIQKLIESICENGIQETGNKLEKQVQKVISKTKTEYQDTGENTNTNEKLKPLKHTEENASVVEKQDLSSLPLTTLVEEEDNIENNSKTKISMYSLKNMDTQKTDIDCSAQTATSQWVCMDIARILKISFEGKEYDFIELSDGSLVWNENLEPYRKQQKLNVAENVLKYGTGGINIDESRVGIEGGGTHCDNRDAEGNCLGHNNAGKSTSGQTIHAKETGEVMGRFPANLITDGSEEVRECFPETKSNGEYKKTGDWQNTGDGEIRTWDIGYDKLNKYAGQEGNASRFFKSIIYQAKASKSERNAGLDDLPDRKSELNSGGIGRQISVEKRTIDGGENAPVMKNHHPTVKPIALMEYLIKMVTPKGGVVLDPFAGSGSTLVAAKQNGFQYIGIEMTPEYIPIIEARLKNLGSKQTTLL